MVKYGFIGKGARWKAIANSERLYTPSTAETSTASMKSVAISSPDGESVGSIREEM